MSSNTQKLVTKLTKSVYIKTLRYIKIVETTLSYIGAIIKYIITFEFQNGSYDLSTVRKLIQ